jgi:hypothetical protein
MNELFFFVFLFIGLVVMQSIFDWYEMRHLKARLKRHEAALDRLTTICARLTERQLQGGE